MFLSALLLTLCIACVCFSWVFLYLTAKKHNENISLRREVANSGATTNILPFYDAFSQSLSLDAKKLIGRLANIDDRILDGDNVEEEFTAVMIEVKDLAVQLDRRVNNTIVTMKNT